MKVAVSATGKDLNTPVEARFGRCDYFIIIDTADMHFEVYENESGNLGSGAGIQAASFVASKGAEALLTGSCGTNAMTTLAAAGVTVYTGQTGSVKEAVERLKAEGLSPTTQPNVAEKSGLSNSFGTGVMPAGKSGRRCGGTGRGMGMGGGIGTGRGMGMGQGRGMGRGMSAPLANSQNPATTTLSREETLTDLKKQAENLQKQIEAIQNKIDSI